MSINYYDDFLLEEERIQEPKGIEVDKDLTWILLHPTAKEAYTAINNLKMEKLRFISGHPDKGSYKYKKYWTISKVEVARRVGKKPQPLFNSNTYSAGLITYFNGVNSKLHKAKYDRINKPNKGYQHKTKEELKASTVKLTKENKKLLQNTCEELYGRMLNDIPLDVKRKLGLN
ncbi:MULTISPECIES: hypothetical protein [Thalassotalea]|uniref:Uncharacterized protein n=1 Tax=Thalassotalea piscium TaxID=1230533 RepID=A0A7X0TUC9_9GAMM|nr:MULTISPECIES: hypothetical protein [Thalassotalea]MBB6544063.1 hypothetical protein [Thalassotalea piscium]